MTYDGHTVQYKHPNGEIAYWIKIGVGTSQEQDFLQIDPTHDPALIVYASVAEARTDRKAYFTWRAMEETRKLYPDVDLVDYAWLFESTVDTDATNRQARTQIVNKRRSAYNKLDGYTTIQQCLSLTWEAA